MRQSLVWIVEQMCRMADARVCAIANLTDEDPEFVGVWSQAASVDEKSTSTFAA
jgi:hypothetical protein